MNMTHLIVRENRTPGILRSWSLPFIGNYSLHSSIWTLEVDVLYHHIILLLVTNELLKLMINIYAKTRSIVNGSAMSMAVDSRHHHSFA
jgi:hypothetical protein